MLDLFKDSVTKLDDGPEDAYGMTIIKPCYSLAGDTVWGKDCEATIKAYKDKKAGVLFDKADAAKDDHKIACAGTTG